jgi:hypothetical protein
VADHYDERGDRIAPWPDGSTKYLDLSNDEQDQQLERE